MYKITKRKTLSPFAESITIEAPLAAKNARAGQFVIIRPFETSERIPLTIADYDGEKGTVTLIFAPVGKTTFELASLKEGEYVSDICGPLGKATDVSGAKNVIVIGGGVGCAIALPVAKAFKKAGAFVTSVIGFKNAEAVILKKEFEENSDNLVLVTDDGSAGEKGFVTAPLKRMLEEKSNGENGARFDEVVAIGPLPMMKNVCAVTRPFGVKTVVSMNPIMIDGTGMCGGCRLKVGGKIKFACVDGPDFDGHEVDFDSLSARNSQYKEFEKHERDAACNLFKGADL